MWTILFSNCRAASWIARSVMISNIVLKRMLTGKSSISSVAVMEICVIGISHGTLSQRNHLMLYMVCTSQWSIFHEIFHLSYWKYWAKLNFFIPELEPVPSTEQQVITLVLSISIPMLLLFVTLSAIFYYYRRKKLGYFNEVIEHFLWIFYFPDMAHRYN